MNRNVDLPGERLQLIDGGRTINVGGSQERATALALEEKCELSGECRFSRSLQTGDQDDLRKLLSFVDLHMDIPKEEYEFIVEDLDELLARRHGREHLLIG